MYTNNRETYRQAFFLAWQKYKNKLPLEEVEASLVEIMVLHKEYHHLLDHPHMYQHQEFNLEENPFFHMSLHLTLIEQIRTNRPRGITALHQSLLAKFNDRHEADHRMMACLMQIMWKTQQTGVLASDEEYLQQLRELG